MIGILNIFHNVAQVHFKDEKNDNLFLSILVNQIVFSLIYFFIILIINFFFSKININIIFFIIILFDQFLSINISLLSVSSLSRGKFLLPNFFLILNRLTQILFILALFIFFEKELKSIFYYLYVMISLKLIFVFIFINNLKLNFVFKNFFFKVYKSDYKNILRPILFTSISGQLKTQLPTIFVGYFFGYSMVTVTRVVIMAYETGLKFSYTVIYRLIPSFVKKLQNLSLNEIKKIDLYLNIFNFFIFLVLFAFLNPIIKLLNLPDHGLMGLGNFEGFYALAYLVNTLFFRVNIQLFSLKTQNFMYVISITKIFTFVTILPLLIRIYDINGLGYFYLIDYLINFLMVNKIYSNIYDSKKLNLFNNIPFYGIVVLLIVMNIYYII